MSHSTKWLSSSSFPDSLKMQGFVALLSAMPFSSVSVRKCGVSVRKKQTTHVLRRRRMIWPFSLSPGKKGARWSSILRPWAFRSRSIKTSEPSARKNHLERKEKGTSCRTKDIFRVRRGAYKVYQQLFLSLPAHCLRLFSVSLWLWNFLLTATSKSFKFWISRKRKEKETGKGRVTQVETQSRQKNNLPATWKIRLLICAETLFN